MSVTPQFIGQRYKDTNTGNIWIANSTTPGDWTLEVQNMQMLWSPHTSKLGESLGVYAFNGASIPGITSITFLQDTFDDPDGVDIESAADLLSLYFPNLTSVGSSTFDIICFSCPNLSVFAFPLLASTAGSVRLAGSGVTSLDLPNLVSGNLVIQLNSSLTTLSIPQWLPDPSNAVELQNNAFNAASVNGVLARCVANAAYNTGPINLGGASMAAPSGQGIVDKATLVGRGIVVTTN